jgi:hypothetical protein
MLEKRNLMSHTYDDQKAQLAYNFIVTAYFEELFDVYTTLDSTNK